MRLHEFKQTIISLQTLMERAVVSSWIEDLEYIDGNVHMTVYPADRTYIIPHVPEEIFNDWFAASSKGKFWWSDIKGIYT